MNQSRRCGSKIVLPKTRHDIVRANKKRTGGANKWPDSSFEPSSIGRLSIHLQGPPTDLGKMDFT